MFLLCILVVLCVIPSSFSSWNYKSDLSLCLYAAAPTSYSHNKGGGAINSKDSNDVVSTITADDANCGDIVSFLVEIKASEYYTGSSTVSFKLTLPAGPTDTHRYGVGFTSIENVTVNYGLVENGNADENGYTREKRGCGSFGYDSGVNDNENSVASFTSSLRGTTFQNGATLASTISVTNVEALENIVVRVDARVCCSEDADPECANSELPVLMDSCYSDRGHSCLCDNDYKRVGCSIRPEITCCDQNLCTRDVITYGVNCGCSAIPKNCSDGNPCTNDTCNPTTGVCSNIPSFNCNDNNNCTVDSCDPSSATGCVHKNVSCDDNNQCTLDQCSPITGCSHTLKVCNDHNNCTVDRCLNNTGCNFSQLINCTDNDVCTLDSCLNSSGCVHSPISCNDNISCTVDSCNSTTGCVHVTNNSLCPVPTDKCLVSVCNFQAGCSTKNRVCTDNDLCTQDLCASGSGCYFPPINCSDNNLCTNDSCFHGNCSHVEISCNDGNLCTADSCNSSIGCVHTNISCNDNNLCTLDQCDPSTGCTHTNISCNDGNACTQELCFPATGCSYPNISCNDNNDCTLDQCFPATGCSHTNISCNDNNACTTDQCIPLVGCTYTNITCNDNNDCTLDLCFPSSGCSFPNITCSDGNACTVDQCLPASGCSYSPLNCNDNSSCTIDKCDNSTGCVHTAINCSDSNLCTVDRCLPGTGCDHSQLVVCNSPPSACASPIGKCERSVGCVYTANNESCNPAPCFTSYCDLNIGCVETAVVCDNNPCQIGTCTDGQCSYIPTNVCNDNILCTVDTCIAVGTDEFNCTHVYNPSNCIGSSSTIPPDCGVYFCNQSIDCGVLLEPSRCTSPTPNACQIHTCNALAGGSTTGCGVVGNCDSGCSCETSGLCVCSGPPQKKRSFLSQIASIWNGATGMQWSPFIIFISLCLYVFLSLLL